MVNKVLEEAAEVYRRNPCNAALKPNVDGPTPEYGGSIKDAFIAGAEWQKELDDLETADLLAIAHLQGMEQQKAKMLEVAVEGTVVELGETYKDLSISASAKALNQVLQSLGLEDGDKVRLIIVKADEK